MELSYRNTAHTLRQAFEFPVYVDDSNKDLPKRCQKDSHLNWYRKLRIVRKTPYPKCILRVRTCKGFE